MWLLTTSGFLSVVRNLNSTGRSDALLVRGRVRSDLERLADFAPARGPRPALTEMDDADYRFRLTTSKETVAAFAASCVEAIDYPNFKSEVFKSDPLRERVYEDAWRALRGLSRLPS
jgi:hypothetical protein